jgi:hypothetical protein
LGSVQEEWLKYEAKKRHIFKSLQTRKHAENADMDNAPGGKIFA